MRRNEPGYSQRDERGRSSRSEDYETGVRSKSEEQRARRRQFEIQRARKRGLPLPKRFLYMIRSKSRSKSPEDQHRRTCTSDASKVSILSKKLESSDGTTPLFKGPEGTQVDATELRRIKVDIHRNIPGMTVTGELQRDIVNPEDVVLKRRAGKVILLTIII
ncbi:hypothetical protein ANTQUA_LOCUS7018 [Anthophora quadrimaculata]